MAETVAAPRPFQNEALHLAPGGSASAANNPAADEKRSASVVEGWKEQSASASAIGIFQPVRLVVVRRKRFGWTGWPVGNGSFIPEGSASRRAVSPKRFDWGRSLFRRKRFGGNAVAGNNPGGGQEGEYFNSEGLYSGEALRPGIIPMADERGSASFTESWEERSASVGQLAAVGSFPERSASPREVLVQNEALRFWPSRGNASRGIVGKGVPGGAFRLQKAGKSKALRTGPGRP